MAPPDSAAVAPPISRAAHDLMANAIRALAMDAVEQAQSGHPGLPMGAADIATVLFTRFVKFDAADPGWPDRDRFVLSAGHGSMLLYALLHLLGYEAMTIDQIKRFRRLGSIAAGHPEYGHAPGIETTTGPLGQGLGAAVGMAIAERRLAAEFGAGIVDHISDLGRRKPEIDRHQHDVGLGGAEPEIEKGRRILRQIGDACLRTQAVRGEAVGHAVGAAVEFTVCGVPPLEVYSHPTGANLGVVARDVSDRQDVGEAFALEHASLPIVSCRRGDLLHALVV